MPLDSFSCTGPVGLKPIHFSGLLCSRIMLRLVRPRVLELSTIETTNSALLTLSRSLFPVGAFGGRADIGQATHTFSTRSIPPFQLLEEGPKWTPRRNRRESVPFKRSVSTTAHLLDFRLLALTGCFSAGRCLICTPSFCTKEWILVTNSTIHFRLRL
ncbi:hypothetical protein KCU88_g417, partial [Aureobasidium melanogenum]